MNSNIIRVSEFERLHYSDDKVFKKSHWLALAHYQEGISKQKGKGIEYFRFLKNGVQFTNFVGVIQVGNLTIEILPKIDRTRSTAHNLTIDKLETSEKAKTQTWHNVLLQMLKECKLLRVNHVEKARLSLRNNSILEIYIELFLNELELLMHEGLVKKYRKYSENQLAMKGQVLFSENISRNLVHKERFYVRHTVYSRNNLFNHILFKALTIISSLSNNPIYLDKVNRLLLDFPEMPDIKVNEHLFDRINYDRKTERYREALLIAKMLLLNYRPDLKGGRENVMAILFDMNKLWEEFVYRRLKKEESYFGVQVLRQQSEHFWHPDLLYRPKTIRPDIVIKKQTETIIVDTKWKIISDMMPSDEDLKQMYVYNLFWECDRSVLLYPSDKPDKYHGGYNDFRNKGSIWTKCTIQTVSVLNDDKQLDVKFGRKLMKELVS